MRAKRRLREGGRSPWVVGVVDGGWVEDSQKRGPRLLQGQGTTGGVARCEVLFRDDGDQHPGEKEQGPRTNSTATPMWSGRINGSHLIYSLQSKDDAGFYTWVEDPLVDSLLSSPAPPEPVRMEDCLKSIRGGRGRWWGVMSCSRTSSHLKRRL